MEFLALVLASLPLFWAYREVRHSMLRRARNAEFYRVGY